MANGPLGGFMPTPTAPAQPPQVKLDTTADSRGNFNNFLKNMNGATLVNPPVVAPVMGAMTPNMAPALANIDIFNQPVQMMQEGGVADFGDFFDEVTSVADDDRSDLSDDNIDDSPPDSDMDYTDVFTPDELQAATDIGRATSDSSSDGTTIANENVKFTDLNQNQINEIKSQINNRNEVAITEEDKFFKDGNLTAAGEAELNKRNAADFQLVSAGQVLPSEYLSTASDILGTGEKSVMDALDLTKPIDPFDIQPTVITTPAALGLPTVASRFNVTPNVTTQTTTKLSPGEALQRNVEEQRAAERGRALGPTTFSDDLANFKSRVTDQEGGVGQGFDEIDRAEKDRLRDELLLEGEIAQNFRNRDYNLPRNISLNDLIAATTPGTRLNEAIKSGNFEFKGNPFNPNPLMERNLQDGTTQTGTTQTGTTTTTTLPTDYEENVGLPFSDKRMTDIERLYNVPAGQRRIGEGDDPNTLRGIPTALNFLETVPREQMAIDIALGRPRGLGEMIRGFTATPARNMAEFTNRLQRNIADESGETRDFTSREIPESQLIRNNRGRVIGIRDSSGRLVTGMDPDAPIGGDDGGDPTPIIRPLTPKPEEPKPELPPNVIGGTSGQIGNLQPVTADTVVASPFAPASSNIQPISFDSGELNKLIELLTGVPARPVVAKQEGGLVSAVDEFLASAS